MLNKRLILDIVEDLLNHSTKSQGTQIPDDQNSSNRILMDKRFVTGQNLPYEQVTDIANHACVSLIGVLQHLFARKIYIVFAEETDIKGS